MHFSDKMALWTKGVGEQIAFWTVWIKTHGYEWPAEFKARVDAARPLDPIIADLIPAHITHCSLLDVGAGPLTCLGKVGSGSTLLDVSACDPLAKVYQALLEINGITPLVPTAFANAENLSVFYPVNQFDITHCRNALDHSLDPLTGLIEMLRVTKVGGYVVLDHELNEGVHADYHGLHQYNFDVQDGRFIIWNPSLRIDVATALPIKVDIRLQMADGMFKTIIHKLEDFADTEPASRYRKPMAELLEHAFDVAISEGLRQSQPANAKLSA